MYLFNNCHDRKHPALYGPKAFFDLETSGYQARGADRVANELVPAEHCIVATRDMTGDITLLVSILASVSKNQTPNEAWSVMRITANISKPKPFRVAMLSDTVSTGSSLI